MSAELEQSTWFRVLLAVRWPVAVVASAGLLGGALLQVLSRPIPIRLALPEGEALPVMAKVDELGKPIRVDQLDSALRIRVDEQLQVQGSVGIDRVGIDVDTPIPVQGSVGIDRVGIDANNPIPISGEPRVVVTSPIAVKADEPLQVKGAVDVSAGQPLPVTGDVEVATPRPLRVDTDVTLDTDDEPVQIQVKGGLTGIF